MRIANNLDDDSVVFLDLEIELTEKGFEEFEGGEAQLRLEEQASSCWRFVVDYYWVWGSLMGLATAFWTGFVVFVLCLSYILRRVLSEKKAEEMRLL